jgi:hypothetical protein
MRPVKLLSAMKKVLPVGRKVVAAPLIRRWDFDADGTPFYLDPKDDAWLQTWILTSKGSTTTGAAPAAAEGGTSDRRVGSSP